MDRLILEFLENNIKVAEIPMSALDDLSPWQMKAFGKIQELLGRRVLIRMEDEE